MSEGVTSILFSLIGIVVILGIAYALSSRKKHINLRVVGAAFALQALMALLVLRTSFGVALIGFLSDGVIALLDFSKVGIEAVFGPMDANPFTNTFVIAALPVIVFFAAIVSILYHLGIMQRLVRWVCGAIGCPILESRPFSGSRMSWRMDVAAKRYLRDSSRGAVIGEGRVQLSKIFEWYADDFGGRAGTIAFARRRRSSPHSWV